MTDATKKKIIRWFWILFAVPVLLVLSLIGLVWAFADIPSFEELENPDSKLATQVIAEDGEILTTFHIENRSYVSYEELSPNLVNAAVATEDSRFYKHSGIDFESHPEHKPTGGYLKVLDESECSQIWWDELDNSQKEIIKSIPNFNESIFEEITGIKVDKQA